jgi:hypothetical protein
MNLVLCHLAVRIYLVVKAYGKYFKYKIGYKYIYKLAVDQYKLKVEKKGDKQWELTWKSGKTTL